jgi:hypothetical protein
MERPSFGVAVLILTLFCFFPYTALQSIVAVIRLTWLYVGAPHRVPIDVSTEELSTPRAVEHIAEKLMRLGFHHLGVVRVLAPGWIRPETIWRYGNSDGTICADVAQTLGVGLLGRPVLMRARVIFYSYFQNEAILVTSYPVGARVNRPDHRWHRVWAGVKAAYERHIRELTDFRVAHGEPVLMQTIDDLIQRDHVYNVRHSRTAVKHQVALAVANLLVVFVCYAVVLYVLVIKP